MMNADTEKIIVGAWLHEEHLDDLSLFETSDFDAMHEVVACLKSGERNPIQIAKLVKVKPNVIAEISTHHNEFLYESAMNELSQQLAMTWISEHPRATPSEVAEAMKKFERKSIELPKAPDDPVNDLKDEFDERHRIPFVSTGLRSLDNLMNGIRRKELTSIGARPSVGKSAFVQQVAMEVAKGGHKVLFFPLEMSTTALLERMFLRYARVSAHELRQGLSQETWHDPVTGEAFDLMEDYFKDGNLLIFERCNDLQTIRELIRVHKPYMIVIDQLEQLKDGRLYWSDKRSRFSHMTHELQGIAMDMDVAVWLACQVNRSADESMPTMANLKESGSIEEDSDNVILLHREGDKTEHQRIILKLEKQRAGQCGTIPLAFIAPHFAFYEEDQNY